MVKGTPPPEANPRAVPQELLRAAGDTLGSPVATYSLMFSPISRRALSVLHLADGRKAVMKTAVEGDIGSVNGVATTSVIEREIWMYRNLPDTAPYRPAYYGDVAGDGWIGLLIEYIGDPDRLPPWTDEAIDGTARGLVALHRLPRPADLPPDILRRTIPQPYLERIQSRDRYPGRLPPAYTTAAWWDWFDSSAATLKATFDGFFGPLPHAFCHNDVRSDNMFVRRGTPTFLDWNQVVWSTPARDSVYWAVGVEREGGPPAPQVFERYLAAGGMDPTDDAIRGVLAWWFLHSIDCLQSDDMALNPLLLRIDQVPTLLRWLLKLTDLARPPVAL